jgi:AcrR family transcriptional regulator
MSDAPRRRLGREGSVDALVGAARELFAEHGPDAVSLRDVARRAGVSHGLIHHYIGSRDDLLRLVFDRSTDHARAEIEDAADPVEALGVLRSLSRDGDDYSRLLAWSLLERRDPAEFHGRSSALDAVIATDPDGSDELRFAVAAAMVQILGWKLFGTYALTAAGLQESDADDLRRALEEITDERVRAASRSLEETL